VPRLHVTSLEVIISRNEGLRVSSIWAPATSADPSREGVSIHPQSVDRNALLYPFVQDYFRPFLRTGGQPDWDVFLLQVTMRARGVVNRTKSAQSASSAFDSFIQSGPGSRTNAGRISTVLSMIAPSAIQYPFMVSLFCCANVLTDYWVADQADANACTGGHSSCRQACEPKRILYD
jgi:hypothetical protein